MNFSLVTLLIVTTIVAPHVTRAVSPLFRPKIDPDCTYTSEEDWWKDECNTCRCTETGLAVCTLIGCFPGFRLREGEAECNGGAIWKRDCNTCECINGKASCTRVLCETRAVSPPIRPKIESDCTYTTEEASWKKECNTCRCTESGLAVCTRIGCFPGYRLREGEEECNGGAIWKRDCNTCECIGGKASCTRVLCVDEKRTLSKESKEPVECQVTWVGDTWMNVCNHCSCITGGKAVCSRMLCLPGFRLSEDEPECTGGAKWKRDCNDCECIRGRASCTRMLCPRP